MTAGAMTGPAVDAQDVPRAVRTGEDGLIVYRRASGIDAIDEHSRHLVQALAKVGVGARYISDGLSPVAELGTQPRWILLQYNPFGYGRAGLAPGLIRDVRRVRARSSAPLLLMVHEAWIEMDSAKSMAIGLCQRAQLRALQRLADRVLTSTEALARELGPSAVHVPVGANITPISMSPTEAKQRLGLGGELAVALFGRGNPSRALDYADTAIRAVAEAQGAERLVILNLGAGAPDIDVPPGIEVRQPGSLPAESLSMWLLASDLVLLPFTDGVSTRRSTLMAALAHGRPVIGLEGRSTDAILTEARDALVLTKVGDEHAYARKAVELSGDLSARNAIGDAGRRLYESHFDWPVAASSVASALAELPSAGSLRVTFVAHDVGGGGGMERQSEQLVTRLLERGHSVDVVARTCSIENRDRLRFTRVPTPRRPFSLAYPAFFAAASVLLARRRSPLLHTTGAIVANRADLSTVHYCHRAAATRIDGPRASRAGRLYLLNSAICAALSRAAEAWCYQPEQTRLLCAVSRGVADELRTGFPAMGRFVRTVPNGVDSKHFHPDRAARSATRAELGIDDVTPLALFVGGDWSRKGLLHAVRALPLALGWHLAVAGVGDTAPITERARADGTLARLHLLGRVIDTPRLYAAADAFVLPTTYEAFPLVALEAAASGLPLLVTRVNGVEDLLIDGSNGWFIRRDADEIARRLNQLSDDSDLACAMREAARLAGCRYTWDAMVDGYLSVYRELTDAA